MMYFAKIRNYLTVLWKISNVSDYVFEYIREFAAYVVFGINSESIKDGLNIVVGENESSKYWLSVLNSPKNRGVQDMLILWCDDLTGIKDAVLSAFSRTKQQRCIVHMDGTQYSEYVSNKDTKTFVKDLKTSILTQTKRLLEST